MTEKWISRIVKNIYNKDVYRNPKRLIYTETMIYNDTMFKVVVGWKELGWKQLLA